MKVVKVVIGTVLFAGVALVGLKFYTQNSHDEMAGVVDQLNPLVTKGEVYAKTKNQMKSIHMEQRLISKKLPIKRDMNERLNLQVYLF